MLQEDLQLFFGKSSFRPGQEKAIKILEQSEDVFVILPTSSGKSLIFQLASLQHRRKKPGTWTLVICPLVALIQEQVEKLNVLMYVDDNGLVQSCCSSLDNHHRRPMATFLGAGQNDETLTQRVRMGEFPIVYVSPEKIESTFSPDFFIRLNLLVIDECHCISEHGSTFRPSYRNIRKHIPHQQDVPTIALTATATLLVQQDVITNLQMKDDVHIVRQTMIRSNLHLRVVKQKFNVFDIVRPLTGRTLIYTLTRKQCERMSEKLRNIGIPSEAYHAGLPEMERLKRAHHFQSSGNHPVLVATICYGLGMDVPDIRLIIHDGLPKSILGYVQETGRGGRDGFPTNCVLYCDSSSDMMKHIRLASTSKEIDQVKEMLSWANNKEHICRFHLLRRVFGEETSTSSSCENHCDTCSSSSSIQEISSKPPSSYLKLLLQAMHQTGNRHGRCVPIDFLRGSKKKTIPKYHERDSVFGHGQNLSKKFWENVHHQGLKDLHIREICTYQGYVIFKTNEPR
jgi:ATP-dependent DNA helicase RecQ